MKEFEKKFGFGFMRLPELSEGEYDVEQVKEMVDIFMDAGFTYFDTAHGYCNGKSELVLKEALTKRYPRDAYYITDKLSDGHFDRNEDIRPLLDRQLEAVGVDYFDIYLMHALGKGNYDKYKDCDAFNTAVELKKEGKIRHIGMSFHDTAEVLDMILTEQPCIEVVQLQFNYLDYENKSVQAKLCYEVCVKHGKPVICMEPVNGGKLVNLPPKAQEIVDALQGGSNASYAIRFCAGFDNVAMVISGMGTVAMVEDNVSYMKDFKPLNEEELNAISKVVDIFRLTEDIPCTGCSYCTERCSQDIPIPAIFSLINESGKAGVPDKAKYDEAVEGKGTAADCIKCGVCERACPQHIEIRKLLDSTAKTLAE